MNQSIFSRQHSNFDLLFDRSSTLGLQLSSVLFAFLAIAAATGDYFSACSSLLSVLISAGVLTIAGLPLIYFWALPSLTAGLIAVNKQLNVDLNTATRHAATLETELSKLAFQKRILDQHAIVSETDASGIITYANDAFCRISRLPREALIGQSHSIVNGGIHSPEFWKDMYDTLGRGEVWQGEVCNRAGDGSHYWVQATNAAVHDEDGVVLGYVSVRTDITENKLHQQRLEHTQQLLLEATADAEAANRAKSGFLATMSHEIRTPMNGVLGMLGLLMDCDLPTEQKKLVRTARESADSLLVIINDILDYSKLEAGRIQLENITFSLNQILDSVISLLKSRADSKNLYLELDLAPDLPPWITGDPTRLRQILFNLIGNAIKFTERGGVRAIVSHKTTSSDGIEVSFEIRDTGIGIPKEARSRLFTRFSQADDSTTRRFGGTGLGLAISKQLANLMGGEIGVESVVGKGSRFWFTIIAQPADKPELLDSPAATAYDDLLDDRLRILVADDNHVNQMFVRALLTKRGHTVDVVSNGAEALVAVQRCSYDIVLMDVQMPEMDGVEATRRLRNLDGPAGSIPIIALTANAMTGQREEYLAAGMDDYISKPIEPMQLFSSIVRVFLSSRGRHTSAERDAQIETTSAEISTGPSIPVIDEERINDLKKYLDGPALRLALSAFPQEALECVSALKSAVASSDSAALHRAVHRLQGMASNFGASRLTHILSQISANDYHGTLPLDWSDLLSDAVASTIAEINAVTQ